MSRADSFAKGCMNAAPAISPNILRFFRRIVRGYFRRHFHAVRLSAGIDAASFRGPLIVYANHSSWWDPMVAFFLGEELFANRPHYAPMDATALARYRILSRLGVFPVELNSARGAVQFLRTGQAVLAAGAVLWVTPQGRFADVRERPLTFKPGLAALAARVAARHGSCTLLPLAIEYPFWDERLPECLLRVGSPVIVTGDDAAEEIEWKLRAALAQEMDLLAQFAAARSPSPFRTVQAGSAGTGGFYALAKKLKAFILRRPYVADHTAHLGVSSQPSPIAVEMQSDVPLAATTRTSEAG
jgi:1-acyl-sn-glycerol-3-phosphate acyltransferase